MDKQNVKALLIALSAAVIVCAIVYKSDRRLKEPEQIRSCKESNKPDGTFLIECDELRIPSERKD